MELRLGVFLCAWQFNRENGAFWKVSNRENSALIAGLSRKTAKELGKLFRVSPARFI